METNDYFCAPIAARHGVRFAFGVLFAVALIAAPLVSCASSAAPGGRRAAIDPARATYGLAPLERKAALPNEGVYYELFVRSFADSKRDGIGDFRGLVANSTISTMATTGRRPISALPASGSCRYFLSVVSRIRRRRLLRRQSRLRHDGRLPRVPRRREEALAFPSSSTFR
jgi:hypothetical protein